VSQGVNTERRVTYCRECHKRIVATRTGRPRVVCGFECERARRVRLAREHLEADLGDSHAWWVGLSWDQRCAAVAWGRVNPCPKWFTPRSLQLWCYYNRAEFSCEGHVTSALA
jgi:hypothetical protein